MQLGGTKLLLRGTGFIDYFTDAAGASDPYGPANGGAPPPHVPLLPHAGANGGDLRCRIGDVLVPTTRLHDTLVACEAPPISAHARRATEVGGGAHLFAGFGAGLPNASVLLGDARIEDGVLKLTDAVAWRRGSFVMAQDVATPPLAAFDATFEVLLGGGTVVPTTADVGSGGGIIDAALEHMASRAHEPLSGEGLSFAFGDLAMGHDLNDARLRKEPLFAWGQHGPMNISDVAGGGRGAFGASFLDARATFYDGADVPLPAGAWRGLRLSLLTYTSRSIEVHWDGEVLASVHLGTDLRILSWAKVRVTHGMGLDADGALVSPPAVGSGLSVWYDGRLIVDDAPLPGFAPTARWAWGFGAATSRATDNHWVDNFRVASPWLAPQLHPSRHGGGAAPAGVAWHAPAVSYPVSLTLNRQEYYDVNQVTGPPPPNLTLTLPPAPHTCSLSRAPHVRSPFSPPSTRASRTFGRRRSRRSRRARGRAPARRASSSPAPTSTAAPTTSAASAARRPAWCRRSAPSCSSSSCRTRPG